ncbi:hypothetical protein N7E02_11780 [Aliirhizobium terrae]|uniref:RNase A-like domain-containing protein n=1 Tax=Terrirhizobium terrae TaxID=2926709 RepID=UPI002574E51A|nr:RNase A-like domain-containing protein [Rhizobium sp. CC-CFT758]WJH41147.1 hypothetical protein N7E02_11780 [Rhizobium sp. CC-CFT758]
MIAAARTGGNDGLRVVLSLPQLLAVFAGETAGGEAVSQSVIRLPDIMVPIAGAAFAGAVRVSAVTAGRPELMKHEVFSGVKLGICPIGLGDKMLRRPDGAAGAADAGRFTSTFENLLIAERSLALALRIRSAMVSNWLRTAPRGKPIDFGIDVGRAIGRGLAVNGGGIRSMTRIDVRLTRETYNGRPFVVAIARPVA